MIDFERELSQLENKLRIDARDDDHRPRQTIMIVDDDYDYRSSLVDYVSNDYTVIACSSGEEALDKINVDVCAVILDIKMPIMDGFTVFRKIKEEFSNIPIIFNTGFPGSYIEQEIESQYQPFAYVTKDRPEFLIAHTKSAVKHCLLSRNHLELIDDLKETNAALNFIIKHHEAEKMTLAKRVVRVFHKMTEPLVNDLLQTDLNDYQKGIIESIQQSVGELLSPFSDLITSDQVGLTPREIEVASLVRGGKTTRQIAERLFISENAVAVHRRNIRAKLGLTSKKINLYSYLQNALPINR